MTGKDSRDALEKHEKTNMTIISRWTFHPVLARLLRSTKCLSKNFTLNKKVPPSRARSDIELLCMNMCSQRNKIRISNDKSSVLSQKDGSTFDKLVAIR